MEQSRVLFAGRDAATAPQLTKNLRSALASAEPRRMLELLGTTLAVHDSDPNGDKPTIICLHAIGHGGSDFATFEAAFAERYRVITVDWPGHGASASDREPVSAQRYAVLLAALIDRLALPSVVLLGNSIGGAAAIRYAAAHPQRVRALLLANPGGLDRNPGGFFPRLLIGQIEKKMQRGVEGAPEFARWFARFYRGLLRTPEAAQQRDAIVAAGYEHAALLVEAWQSFARADSDARALARSLPMPVFVAWARRDGIIRWSRNRAAVQAIPHAEVQFFEAGHAAFLESPREFQRVAGSFLARLEAE